MRVLITGITGFAGSHLADYLCTRKGVEVFGLARKVLKNPSRHFSRREKIVYYSCDVTDASAVERALRRIRPERIFHLAAQASVPVSWKKPRETFEQNFTGTLNVLEAARKSKFCKSVHIAGSAQEYGFPPEGMVKISEKVPIHPSSPYAVSKAVQDLMAAQYAMHFHIKVVRTRGFNHIGPRQTEDFLTSSLARQIALIEAGRQKPLIEVGNVDTVRDYTDVRDVVQAYWLALEKGSSGEVYNVASGRGRTVRQMIGIFLQLTDIQIKIGQDPARMRSNDLPRLVGNPEKLMRATGWRPQIGLKTSLVDLLNYWRQRIQRGEA